MSVIKYFSSGWRRLTIAGLAIFLLTAGLGCVNSSEVAGFTPVELQYWGVFEEPEAIALLTRPYTGRHPLIKIRYRKFSPEEYKGKLLENWALGTGPDLFMVPASSLREYMKFAEPMPASMRSPVQYEKGTLKKETVTEMRTYKGLSPKQVRDTFLDIVADSAVVNDKIYGLPYSVDTLALYYNRQILKDNNIPLPAKDWSELIDQAKIISKLDANDTLVQSTIAMGTTENISAAFDIISNLMMQTGVTMGDASGPQFQSNADALTAINFYLSFAETGRSNYSWNKDMSDAFDAFTAGKVAYFIGYPYQADQIRKTNPNLDWDVTPVLKPANSDTIPTYADYWLTLVAKPPVGAKSEVKQRAELSWQYLLEATSANEVKAFLNNPKNRRTTALKSLVQGQQNDLTVGPFAANLLNAADWYRGYDFEKARGYFLDMVDNINAANQQGTDARQYLQAGASLISQTYRAP